MTELLWETAAYRLPVDPDARQVELDSFNKKKLHILFVFFILMFFYKSAMKKKKAVNNKLSCAGSWRQTVIEDITFAFDRKPSAISYKKKKSLVAITVLFKYGCKYCTQRHTNKVLMFLFVKIHMTTTDRFLLWDYILCIIVKNYCQIPLFTCETYRDCCTWSSVSLIYLLCGFVWREKERFCRQPLVFCRTLRLKVKCKC